MVKRTNKASDGLYHINGIIFKLLKGSRAEVWHGTAFKTSGNLEKKNLMKNDRGRIVSRSKHTKMKKENGSRLRIAGWDLATGKFGPRRIMREKTKSITGKRKNSTKKRGSKTL